MGYLHHLAGMALGGKSASTVRPSLPPRFAASPFAGPSQGLEAIERVPSAMPAPRAQPEPVRGTPPLAPHPIPLQQRETPPSMAVRSPLPPPPVEAREAEVQAIRRVASPSPSPPRPDLVDVVRRGIPAEVPTLAVGERSRAGPVAKSRPTPPRLDIETPADRAVTRAAPLSAAVVAGRTTAVREQAPVIHVTIDRLDVRAPVRTETARQRSRPQPAVSLSDYLRDGSSGGRR